MSGPGRPVARPGGVRTAVRMRLTDPALPVVALGAAAVAAALHAPVLTWAITGGLAGYSLSGSV
ncbi:hypothetical protein [Streptomyces chromofuscus]|uniref:Uncharacterized protein n=1 Tax=Streptomyces chromofuscus TaxID=42881 RepID=A0A7M2TGL8_STRCW|nr:hypothetical protein [Streptomyces chromofuscus]QOV47906.1 hypothetical protein IPT68_02140 [Streptomyces chromofuscus]GGT33573.1 hypothetical protein GCM10010254_62480 [Streptomyces chromofuscus]